MFWGSEFKSAGRHAPALAFFVALFLTLPLLAEDISTSGWRLWPDQKAEWRNDTLYLPDEVDLAHMPVNEPTGGWDALGAQQGVAVKLPSTVEDHYWGAFGLRPYTLSEAQKGPRTTFENGNYVGVSWWWRDLQIPQFKPGQRVIVSFRGARLRAEVYCNQKLCGYSLMGELPFVADLTDAVRPGQPARIAVRITNPGGHFDWIDFAQMFIRWGKYDLPPSHGFGGLDSDIQMDVRDPVAVTDVAAINTPELDTVRLVAEVSAGAQRYDGPVLFTVMKNGQSLWTGHKQVSIEAGKSAIVDLTARLDHPQLWDVEHPNLYQARAQVGDFATSGKEVSFGFRYFTAEGIGDQDARLALNGRRIVVRSAISWGFWGGNGLWPDQTMAEREVSAAKELGLNCLQFHRNIGREAVLDIQDRQGLLRCEEPGGGKFAIGHRYARGPFGPNGEFLETGEKLLPALAPKPDYKEPDRVDTSGAGPDAEPVAFWEKYEEQKILMMVKRDRSHPSLIMYTLQNESSNMDLRNPRIYRIFRRMHELDPSRPIVFYSGGVPKDSQVLMLPYSDEIRYGSKTLPFAGWRDIHTCGGPCNYKDVLYNNPQDFKVRSKPEDRKLICMWGEMFGAATPDDYEQILKSQPSGAQGYDLADMRKILKGYHDFVDKWGFRQAFSTDSSLFQTIGNRGYYFWKRVIEQARADNANDYLVISGWESTTLDNHSGIVDNRRFFKGNPQILAEAMKPLALFVQPRRMIVAAGEKDLLDVYLLNEKNLSGPQTLTVTVRRPDGSVALTTQKNVTALGGDQFGQLLAEGLEIPADVPGMLKIEAALAPAGSSAPALTCQDEIHVVDLRVGALLGTIAVAEPDQEITRTLSGVFKKNTLKLSEVPAATHLDAIVLAAKGNISDLFSKAAKTEAPAGSQNLVPETMPGASSAGKPNPPTDFMSVTITPEQLDQILTRVRQDGTRLVLWPDTNRCAEAFAKELAKRGVVKFSGMSGNLGAPWFGSWNFTRRHWLLAGLPTDCVMDWRYGISVFGGPEWLKENPKRTGTDGLLLDSPGMEVFVGFGADHNPRLGIDGCVIPYGKGQIVFYCLPQLVQSLVPGNFAIDPVIAQRLLANTLRVQP